MLMVITWISLILAGFVMMVFASQKAIRHSVMFAQGFAVPPFIIGITLVSIGTDLPEIANSIASSVAGHGDLNVGDSIGSVATQITLVLGLLPFLAGSLSLIPKRVILINGLTVIGLAIGAYLISDGFLSRTDALILFIGWVLATYVAVKLAIPLSNTKMETSSNSRLFHGTIALLSLLMVGVGASAAVKGIIELAAMAGIPEYLISFFGSSVGTSLPELVVDYTAIRNKRKDIAIGDVLGSCMVDATLSISAGPLFAPTAVTAYLAMRGAVITMIIVASVTIVLALNRKHDYRSGLVLLLFYAATYYFLIKP